MILKPLFVGKYAVSTFVSISVNQKECANIIRLGRKTGGIARKSYSTLTVTFEFLIHFNPGFDSFKLYLGKD